ncbi:hypothetical protein TcWFU_006526 [Taenia crassiceps]|uniref:Uncharacterized protein n=1 Tax=Taenia crassiceps TaxID=6207 RepID=A0ABR4QID7_9CEST
MGGSRAGTKQAFRLWAAAEAEAAVAVAVAHRSPPSQVTAILIAAPTHLGDGVRVCTRRRRCQKMTALCVCDDDDGGGEDDDDLFLQHFHHQLTS